MKLLRILGTSKATEAAKAQAQDGKKRERIKDFSLSIFSSMHNTTYRASKPDNISC